MVTGSRTGDFELDTDKARLDLDLVWSFLSTEAYWGRWRTREIVEAQVSSAWRVIGLYDAHGTLIGFARAVSDGVALGYLADVFVLPAHRGQGLGRDMVEALVSHGPGATMRWLLHTADAHGFYGRLGFSGAPTTLMEREAPAR
jgi:GNAT superfamily N-acetyltransferase